jgi:hypothetical protein
LNPIVSRSYGTEGEGRTMTAWEKEVVPGEGNCSGAECVNSVSGCCEVDVKVFQATNRRDP